MRDNLELEQDGQINISQGIGARLLPIKGNRPFKDQFNLHFCVRYFDITAGVQIGAAALPAALQNQLPVFLFGNSDYSGGFEKVNGFFPLTTWTKNVGALGLTFQYGIFQKEQFAGQVLALANPFEITGDLFFNFHAVVAGNIYAALVTVHCPQVAYGSLLDSINSEVFLMNMIRYEVPLANLNQLQNNVLILCKSTFGKAQHDWFDPNLYITGKTFNQNIADIPLEMEINKSKGMGFYINYDCTDFNWSILVEKTRKITS